MYSLIRTRAVEARQENDLGHEARDTRVAAPRRRERRVRVIKRYSNRKLYDTKDSRYVTLLQIAEMVREGEEVQIIDNNTKEDLTEVTLAQIIYEEQKAHSRSVPLQTLKELIHARTEKVLADCARAPSAASFPGVKADATRSRSKSSVAAGQGRRSRRLVDQAKEKLEEVQHQLDERIRAILPTFRPLQQLQQEVRRLNERVEDSRRKLKGDAPDRGLTRRVARCYIG